jgi:ribose 5-phosphate isomerase A
MTDKKLELKKIAAEKAVEQIQSGMLIGLGVGSTAIHAVNKIAELIKTGQLVDIKAVACSKSTHEHAEELGIPLISLEKDMKLDITIDGADEVSEDLNLIKGGGGALLREKIIAQSTKREIIVIDDSKLSQHLGENFPLPVEVLQFAWESHLGFLQELGCIPKLRLIDSNKPYITDQGNYIIDCDFGAIKSPYMLAEQLDQRAGIIEHGLFLGLTSEVIVASETGLKILKI